MRVSRSQLAGFFGVTPPTVDGWVRRGCPVATPAKGRGRGNGAEFWTPDVLRWWVEHAALKGRAAGGASKDIRHRLQQIELENAEIDLATKRGELMTVPQFREALGAAMGRLSARVKSLPPVMAAASVGVSNLAEGFARAEPIVNDLLLSLAAGEDVPIGEGAEDAPIPEVSAADAAA